MIFLVKILRKPENVSAWHPEKSGHDTLSLYKRACPRLGLSYLTPNGSTRKHHISDISKCHQFLVHGTDLTGLEWSIPFWLEWSAHSIPAGMEWLHSTPAWMEWAFYFSQNNLFFPIITFIYFPHICLLLYNWTEGKYMLLYADMEKI